MSGASTDFRMLVLDLDGTAVRSDGSLAAQDLEAVRALIEAGIFVTIATGRIFSGTVDVARALGVDGLVACSNGSELVEVASAEVRHGCYVHADDRECIRDAFARHGLSAVILTTHDVHHEAEASVHAPLLRMWSPRLVPHRDAIHARLWTETAEVSAVVGLGDTEASESVTLELRETRASLETLFVREYDGVRSFVKVRRAEVDKGTALAAMARERGVDTEHVVAVGDWYNDTPMLRSAGRSFVVRGAPDEVRAAADETLDAGRGTGGVVAEVARRVWAL